jgi:hypothetical protein
MDRMEASTHSILSAWLAALEARHLRDLTRAELTRSLRALSSCYVERRARLVRGAALDGAGKRAAFALFYAPLHFLTVTRIVRELGDETSLREIVDLGCGTGAAGSAWALTCARPPILTGIDRNAWAVQEANWTYKRLGLRGRALTGDVNRTPLPASRTSAVLLAYTVNELPDDKRAVLLERIEACARDGTHLLVIEPIARRLTGWWTTWADRLSAHVRVDEWRFPEKLPGLLADIAKSAGLDPRELTARSMSTVTGR